MNLLCVTYCLGWARWSKKSGAVTIGKERDNVRAGRQLIRVSCHTIDVDVDVDEIYDISYTNVMKRLLDRLWQWRRFIISGAVAFLILAQFVPVDRSNPPVTAEIKAPTEVHAILKRACYDCHSNETQWPWYSRVAPISWLVAHDVEEAREEMNFSTWGELAADKQVHFIEEIWEEVEEGEMPLWFYRPLHSHAQLSEDDLKTLETWSKTATQTQ